MSTPAIIYIIITLMTLALWGLIHNKSIKVNVWAKLADVTLLSALLYWGGFFS